MSTENNQLVIGGFQFTPFAIKPEVLTMRDEALAASALIGKVETAAQNEQSASARKKIKSLLSLFESGRAKLKEPILEAGRQLDRVVKTEREDLEREDGRLENLEKDFIRAELRRKSEEEELQRKELARIEAEKQAELQRIAREQAEAERKAREAAAEVARLAAENERKAREATEAAARMAAEATNRKQREAAEAARLAAEEASKKQREAAEAARIEAERIARESAEKARQQTQLATERAEAAAFIESKPVEISRARGQSVKKVWVIDQINDFQLMKARPDLVRKIEWDMVGLKQALADGIKLPGVTAHEDIGVGNRGGKSPALIEV